MAKKPTVLLPYQQAWIADNSAVKVWEKSRRIGASWCEAADDVLIASRAEQPNDVWYISYNEDAAREFIRDVIQWTVHFGIVAAEMEEIIVTDQRKNIKAFQVRFASGKRITALSSRPTNIRGKQGVVILDEYAFHEDQAGLLKAAIALLMWGGKVRVLSTHNGIENSFAELIEDIRKGKKPYSLHRTTLDDALQQGLYKRICLKTKEKWSPEAEAKWRQNLIDQYGDGADEELFCIPNQSGCCYFPRLLIEQNMDKEIPVLRLAFKEDFSFLPEAERRSTVQDWLEENLGQIKDWLHPCQKLSYW